MSKSYQHYSEVVKRLAAYRKELQISQSEMGKKFGVTQSHYNKLETGMKTISMRSLQEFSKNKEDVVWLITGQKYQNGIFDHYFINCESVETKTEFLESAVWIIRQGVRKSSLSVKILGNFYKILELLRRGEDEYLIWRGIRENENITQLKMAEILEINIKRYRRIEKGAMPADAAILSSLYSNLGYSPALLLNQFDYCANELNMIWDMFDKELQEVLQEYMNAAFELVK